MPGRPIDLYANLDRGRIIVSKLDSHRWLITWLPHSESDPNYPGFTLNSDRVPAELLEDEEEGILGWALAQEWAASEQPD